MADSVFNSDKYFWSTKDRLGAGATGQVFVGYNRVGTPPPLKGFVARAHLPCSAVCCIKRGTFSASVSFSLTLFHLPPNDSTFSSHKNNGERVAVKMFTANVDFRTLQREIHAVQAISDHENIVKLFEVDEEVCVCPPPLTCILLCPPPVMCVKDNIKS